MMGNTIWFKTLALRMIRVAIFSGIQFCTPNYVPRTLKPKPEKSGVLASRNPRLKDSTAFGTLPRMLPDGLVIHVPKVFKNGVPCYLRESAAGLVLPGF